MIVQQRHSSDTIPAGQVVTIAYLLNSFPNLSETFIAQEIRELERQGLHLHLFSLSEPPRQQGTNVAWERQAPLTYLARQSRRNLLMRATWRFLRHPWRFLHTLIALLKSYRWHAALGYMLYAAWLAGKLESASIRHLHAHYASEPACVAQALHLLTDISYSFTAHAYDIYLSPTNVLAEKIRTARFVVTCTEYNKRYLVEICPASQRHIYCIYHGVDLDVLLPQEPGYAAKLNPPLILAVARLLEKKGLTYLLRACRILVDQGYAFSCRIVGEGPLHAALEQEINELSLTERVTLWGAASHREVVAMFRQATAMALPCIVSQNGDRDGIPNVLVEALCLGIPVVSTPVSGIPELISPEVNGLLVAPRDSEALAAALARLLDDPQLRSRLVEVGRQTVHERFDMKENTSRLLELLSVKEEQHSDEDR